MDLRYRKVPRLGAHPDAVLAGLQERVSPVRRRGQLEGALQYFLRAGLRGVKPRANAVSAKLIVKCFRVFIVILLFVFGSGQPLIALIL